jgi:hypothetical protein
MIKGYCFTNLDDYKKEDWPDKFCIEPQIDHKVRSKSGIVLYIAVITHCIADCDLYMMNIKKDEPYLRIELH